VEDKNIIDLVVIMVNNLGDFFVILVCLSGYSLMDKQVGSNTLISDYSHTLYFAIIKFNIRLYIRLRSVLTKIIFKID